MINIKFDWLINVRYGLFGSIKHSLIILNVYGLIIIFIYYSRVEEKLCNLIDTNLYYLHMLYFIY